MLYFDTAYILKCYLHEAGAGAVRAAAYEHDAGLASSVLGRLEFYSGVHRHYREGRLSKAEARKVLRWFEADEVDGVWNFYPLTEAVRSAVGEKFAALPKKLFLRTNDAVHLATAQLHGFEEVYSNDRHLLAAAPAFELSGRDVTAS